MTIDLVIAAFMLACSAAGLAATAISARLEDPVAHPENALRWARGAVLPIAIAARRIDDGATIACVRGRVHRGREVLEVRDGSGVALVVRRGARIFVERWLGFAPADALEDGDEVIVIGPAARAPAAADGLRGLASAIAIESREGDPVLVLRDR